MASNVEEECCELPYRIEGWLNVWEVDSHVEANLLLEGRVPLPIWEPHFCVITQNKQRLSHYRTEKAADEASKVKDQPRLRLDGSKEAFDKRWGYSTLECIKENVMQHCPLTPLDVFARSQTLDSRSSGSQNSAYEKGGLGERRGSVPVVSTIHEDSMEPPSTPSRLASFFSRKVKSNLKRTKSVTKLDRKRPGFNNDLEGAPTFTSTLKRTMSLGRLTKRWQPKPSSRDGSSEERQQRIGALINSRMRTSRSHESLLMSPSSMNSIDLTAPDVEIKPLHSSILGQEHCFQVSTANGSKYYSCRTAEERQKWIQHLRKTVQPKQEQTRRTENSLKLWVLEAKNVPSKKRYFCELCLDKTLYARTSTKSKGDMLFWGEHFDFNNLPAIDTITVNIYKEPDKKKKKEKNQLLGYIHIPVSEISSRQYVERWYTASSAFVGKAGRDNKGEHPLIRIKARYQTINILPMDMYQGLIDYIKTDYSALVDVLEPQISVKSKEEIATAMVHILERLGCATEFLSDIVMSEVDKLDNENLAFRGNSIATKAMEAYLKLIGEKYLQDTFGDFIKTVLEGMDECEVDPTRVPNNAILQRNQGNLVMYCEMAWFKIINSHCFFPMELKGVFASLKERCEERKKADVSTTLISACIFLRFLCPAILSPSLFNLTREFPAEKCARNLTLIAKTIQSLANNTKFGGKEEFMTFLNDFVEREMSSMETFIKHISTVNEDDQSLEFDGYIDLGKELSIIHALLTESLEKVNEAADCKLGRLKTILLDITEALDNPDIISSHQQTYNNMRIYDNINSMRNSSKDQNANATATNLLTLLNKEGTNCNVTRVNVLSAPSDARSDVSNVRANLSPRRQGAGDMREFHCTDDYLRFTTLDASAPVTDQRLAPSQSTPNAKRPTVKQVNQSWSRIVNAAEMSTITAAEMVNGDYVDLISFMDDFADHKHDADNGDQVSIGQQSTVASSGYQSFGYSQSSSPVESLTNQQPLSFSNPLFGHNGKPLPGGGRLYHSPSSSSLSSEDGTRRRQKKHSSQDSNRTVCESSRQGPDYPLQHNLSCGSSSSSESISQQERRRTAPRPAGRAHLSSPYMSRSSPRVNSPGQELRYSDNPHAADDLSKSAEFAQLRRFGSHGNSVKCNVTDNVGLPSRNTPPESPHHGTMQHGNGSRRPQPQSNTVRMGVSAMSRKLQDPEKTKVDYEQELTVLTQQLAETQVMLQETQNRLAAEEETRNQLHEDWQHKLEHSEERMKQQQQEKDQQMKHIIQRLISVEEELRREQCELQNVVSQKQKIIEAQERRIQSLDAANNRLLAALNQLKDRCQVQNRNGLASPSRSKLQLQENGQFKSSNC